MSARSFGTELRRHRVAAGMTQEALAELLDVSRTTVSQMENGRNRRPGDGALTRLEETVGLSRMRSLALIAGDMTPGGEDVMTDLYRIAALPDRLARRDAWKALPAAVLEVLIVFTEDMLIETVFSVRDEIEAQP